MSCLNYDTIDDRIRVAGRVTVVDSGTGLVEIAIPASMCSDIEGLTHLFTLITSAAEYSYADAFWLESIEIPRIITGRLNGPVLGVRGIRRELDVSSRPIIGLICKPPINGEESKFFEQVNQAIEGGVDLIVDDLLMVAPVGNFSLSSRVHKFCQIVRNYNNKNRGKRKVGYIVNLGMSPFRALENLDSILSNGVFGVMLNSFTMGFGSIEEFRQRIGGRCAIFCTNMGSGVISRSVGPKQTGVSEAVFAKLSRLAGADAVHTGTSASECYGTDAWGPASRSLDSVISGIEKSFAVAEGDISVANLWENIKSLGADLIIEPTTGIFNYPDGPYQGARSFRSMLDMLSPDMSDSEAHNQIQKRALSDSSLRKGLSAFGYKGISNQRYGD
jgi:ribulose 1,5-bisphosphate carboxylase large subunit-like protein